MATNENPVDTKPKGRKPLTDEQKQAAAKARAEAKEKAANMKPAVFVQYQDVEVDVEAVVEKAKELFHEEKKRTKITDLKLYIKPEERAAYYVINEQFNGMVEL